MQTAVQINQDEQARQSILRELESADINASVKNGIATLTGFTHSVEEKNAAGEVAKRVAGIKAIANDIRIKPGRERSDPEIARDALQALRTHIAVPYDRLTITVDDGRVIIEGTVKWAYERMVAEAAVRRLRGIARIENRVKVDR